jgi:hypothetical protein
MVSVAVGSRSRITKPVVRLSSQQPEASESAFAADAPLPPREVDSRNRNNTSTNKSAAQIKVVQSMESRHHAPMA